MNLHDLYKFCDLHNLHFHFHNFHDLYVAFLKIMIKVFSVAGVWSKAFNEKVFAFLLAAAFHYVIIGTGAFIAGSPAIVYLSYKFGKFLGRRKRRRRFINAVKFLTLSVEDFKGSN